MLTRRAFLGTGAGALAAGLLPSRLLAADGLTRVILLHTNDTHSRLDPFPQDGSRFAGTGGIARRATLIQAERSRSPHVLLTDSGDVFQGTPYFNFFHGAADYQAMTRLGYDLATLGNHDFDGGTATLVKAMQEAKFGFLVANLECTEPTLKERVKPWVVREFGGVRLGVFGLTVAFEGLVAGHNHQGARWLDPVPAATRAVQALREQEKVDAVVCLSHLGLEDGPFSPGDRALAAKVGGIDLILGGHTHTFMDRPAHIDRPGGGQTVISQVGFAGIWLGRVELAFEGKKLSSIETGHSAVA
jgi:5'-nucleotidase